MRNQSAFASLSGDLELRADPVAYPKLNRSYCSYVSTVAALLLSLCPNIEVLYLGEGISCGPLADYLLRSNYALAPRPALQ